MIDYESSKRRGKAFMLLMKELYVRGYKYEYNLLGFFYGRVYSVNGKIEEMPWCHLGPPFFISDKILHDVANGDAIDCSVFDGRKVLVEIETTIV